MITDKIKTYIIIALAGLLLTGGLASTITIGVITLKNKAEVAQLKLDRQKEAARADKEKLRADGEKKRADGEKATRETAVAANKSLIEQNTALASADRNTDVRYIDRSRIIEKVVRERDLSTTNWLIDSFNTGFYDPNTPTPSVPATK